MTEDFIPLCETLWQDWLADSLTVSPFVEATFDMNASGPTHFSDEPVLQLPPGVQ